MTIPRPDTSHKDLDRQARSMAGTCGNDRIARVIPSVAVGPRSQTVELVVYRNRRSDTDGAHRHAKAKNDPAHKVGGQPPPFSRAARLIPPTGMRF